MADANHQDSFSQWPAAATSHRAGADSFRRRVPRAELPVPPAAAINLAVGAVAAALWALFAYRHLLAFKATQEWVYLAVCLSETLAAAFFLIRSAPVTVSTKPSDWMLAFGGTFTPFLFVPSSSSLLPGAVALTFLGTILQIASLICLNRSFALVAAKRTIKTKGMYRIVRHPLYASHWLVCSGYLLTNFSWANLFVYVFAMVLLAARAVREEAHLSEDATYRAYMQQVRWRIVPGVF